MANTIVLGMQWGDEGKGKIVDLIGPAFDGVVRFQGGHNAGHTVKFGDNHFALHLLPSGILRDGMQAVLGNGMVISPEAFFKELDGLHAAGIETDGRLFVSDRAALILPFQAALDAAREAARGEKKIGTTSRGIGPAYEAKAARSGLRAGQIDAPDLEERISVVYQQVAAQLRDLGADVPDLQATADACRKAGERLRPYLADTAHLLNGWIEDGRSLLFEGAQGTLLDIDHGTYPFVTSSNATAGGAATGSGVAPTRLDGVLGVLKAYTTRVGSGPFVGELHDETGEHLRRRGNEFGTTTGRPRRCAWLDTVAARYSRMLNGVDVLAVTKLDVLDEVDEIKICTGYRYRGEILQNFPSSIRVLDEAEPVFKTMPGWQQSTVGILDAADLPQRAQDYLRFVEDEVGAPAGLISTGPRREETIVVQNSELQRLFGDRFANVKP